MMRLALSPRISTEYGKRYLTSQLGKAFLTRIAKWAVNQTSINQQDVLRAPMPIPPAEEQVRILAAVDGLFSVAAEIARQIEVQAARCARLRQEVLKAAFEGQLAG